MSNTTYLVVFIVVFVLGVLFHFPLERFGSVITSTIQKQTGYVVQMEKMSLTLPIGIHATNVKVQPPATSGQAFILNVDEMTFRPSIIGYILYPIRKANSFSFKAVRGKEVWNGSASLGPENTSVDVSVKNFKWQGTFPLDPNSMFAGQFISVDTTVDADLELDGKTAAIQNGNFSEAAGSFEVHSKKTDVEAPLVKSVNMTALDIESKLKKGTLDISKLDFKAPNLSAKSSGNIKVAPFFANSRLSLDSVIKADPQDPNISILLPMLEQILKISATSDGTISLKVNGVLNSPESLSIKSF